MADQRLRALERQAAQGDQAAHARWLLARLRAGELSASRLHVAAALGHEPAREALTNRAPAQLGGLNAWEEDMQDWAPDLLVAAALAAGRLGLAAWEERHADDRRLREALEAAEAWAAQRGGAAAVQAAIRSLAEMEGVLAADWAVYDPPGDLVEDANAELPVEVAYDEAAAAPERSARAGGRAVKEAVRCVAWRAQAASRSSLSNYAWKAGWELRWALGAEEAEAALRDALVAWAVGVPA